MSGMPGAVGEPRSPTAIAHRLDEPLAPRGQAELRTVTTAPQRGGWDSNAATIGLGLTAAIQVGVDTSCPARLSAEWALARNVLA
ncbi:hypothetical protein [Nonomuraea basaltis]|uniref:hypothetical protein n=1 Tax=Nonomuraea basaltis TaxID=2495887 RepID=UPI00110C6EA1|nr:hypothetical protein [Nonomuraea basaltis]TMR89551.1 hypothetical protein EJK15_60135 [Nonomuraea basaltis]